MTPEHARPTLATVASLERLLGDPVDGEGPFSFAAIVPAEERDELPDGAKKLLLDWGFADFLVPEGDGGRLRNLESALLLTRTLARRNLTFSVLFGSTLLGAAPVWLWGTDEQRARVAAGLAAGAMACFGISERDHGSDLAASGTTAVPDGDEIVLNGEKWPVGNATRSRFVSVLAQHDGRGLSLFLVDKERLADGAWTNTPFVKGAGLRGHDLSGITFHDARVPRSALVGRPYRGLASVLKTLQITRTAIGAMSLGTMDSALRIGMRYANERVLYGSPVKELPVVREHLVGAHLDLLIAECVALPVARALSVVPSRMSLWSSVVKYLVPVMGEEVLDHVGKVLGARGYLREGVASGALQKLRRDHAITTVFEGTTHVNLHSIATQLPTVAAVADRPAEGGREVLRALFDWSREAPVWSPSGDALQLTSAAQDEITRGWTEAVDEAAVVAKERLDEESAAGLSVVLAELSAHREALYAEVTGAGRSPDSVAASRAAARHCVLHAAASCLYAWLYGGEREGSAVRGDAWLIPALQRLVQRLEPGRLPDERHREEFVRRMDEVLAKGEDFSLLPTVS